MLTYLDIKKDGYALCGVTNSTTRTEIATAVRISAQRAQSKFSLSRPWGFQEQYQDRVYIPLSAPYSTGTVSVTQDSKTITGSGTTWTKDMEGSFFQLTDQAWYEIREFTSTTSMELAIPYQGDDDTGETYRIAKRFYRLPLNFLRPHAEEATLSLLQGTSSMSYMRYDRNASFLDPIIISQPKWFGLAGNAMRADYFNTGTVTVATSSGTSTWTISTGTLPTDIVDREVRIRGEERSYYIKTRSSATAFITYDTYVNPSDATNIISAATYAITPKETQLIGFSNVADQRYIFSMPYYKKLPDMISDNDISPIVLAGYEDAFLAVFRAKLAEDFRSLLANNQDRQALMNAGELALADAWINEDQSNTNKDQAKNRVDRTQRGPSWLS